MLAVAEADDRDAVVLLFEHESVPVRAQEHDALALEAHEARIAHLARDAALARVEPMVDRGGDRGQALRRPRPAAARA